MRRIAYMLAVAVAMSALAVVAVAQSSESLGDVARATRKEKRHAAAKVYTNDNLPTSATLSVVGPSSAAEDLEKSEIQDKEVKPAKDADKKDGSDKKDGKDKSASADSQAWSAKIDDQKKKIADLAHELDLLDREYKLRVTAFYADAGWQLRDSKKWAEDEAKYRSDMADKQKQLDEARAQLEDMQEQARKADAGSSPSE